VAVAIETPVSREAVAGEGGSVAQGADLSSMRSPSESAVVPSGSRIDHRPTAGPDAVTSS
jgi:hypothetical protein